MLFILVFIIRLLRYLLLYDYYTLLTNYNYSKEAIAAGISCISLSLMQIYIGWHGPGAHPEVPEEGPDNDAPVFLS